MTEASSRDAELMYDSRYSTSVQQGQVQVQSGTYDKLRIVDKETATHSKEVDK